MRVIVSRVLLVLALFLGIALVGIWYIGAWNRVFPDTSHEIEPPELAEELGKPAVLVFSKTNGFRHRDGIAGGLTALREIAQSRGWALYATENGAVFNQAQLAKFAAVVFLNTTGDTLNTQQEEAFIGWLESGGGWLGIHAAGDGSHSEWSWYVDNLIGASFTAHILGPQFQFARVKNERPGSPVLSGLPAEWLHEEEWYSWEHSPRDKGFTILLTVDESSYQPLQKVFGRERDLRMGDHPVAWTHCVGEGKTLYSAMGHRAAAFSQPEHRRLLSNALTWLIDSRLPCR